MTQLTQIMQWLEEQYGVIIDMPPEGPESGRTISYHLHASDGTCLADETFTEGFLSIADAICAGMDAAVEVISEEASIDQYLLGHEQLVAAGLAIFPETTPSDVHIDDMLPYEGSWGYCWDCGCSSGGFPDEQAALKAALAVHRTRSSHQEHHAPSPRRPLATTA